MSCRAYMRKVFYAIILVAIVGVAAVLTGYGEEEKISAKTIAKPVDEKVSPQISEEIPPEEVKEVKAANSIPQSDKFIVANKDFSNLQLDTYNKPVFDSYGFWQRQEQGMQTVIPDLQPYYGADTNIVYLTFDDGPDDKNTPQILDILREENVPATFYVLGAMVEAYPEVLKRIFNEGHAIGNHSYNHKYNELYSSAWNFIEQFQRTDEIIMSQIGVRPLIIRAPGGTYGAFNADYWDMVKSSGYVEHDWNISSGDATPQGATAAQEIENIVSQMNTYNFKSAVVLMHSTSAKDETVKALPEIIHFFKDRGYTFGVITPMTPQPW